MQFGRIDNRTLLTTHQEDTNVKILAVLSRMYSGHESGHPPVIIINPDNTV